MSKAYLLQRVPLSILLLSLVVPLLAACGGGGGSAGDVVSADLAVIYFSHRDRTDVYRNQTLEFRFTAPMKATSVDTRTFRVLYGASMQTPLSGARIVDGERIYFNPTLSQRTYERDGIAAVPDQPFGFDALTDYTVLMPGPPELKVMKNLSGDSIVAQYLGNFTTSDLFIPEQDPPTYIGYSFSPPPNEDGSINFEAAVVLEFDEAMNPATIEPGNTLTVYRRITIQTPTGPVVKQGLYPVTVEPSKDGRKFKLLPSINWGSEAEVTVTLTDGIKDLAGNPIVARPSNPGQTNPFVFHTEYKAGLVLVDFITEDFTSNAYEDSAAVPMVDRAEWNTTEPGALKGGPITTTYATITPAPNNNTSFNFNLSWPLVADPINTSCPLMPTGVDWKKGIRLQTSYSKDEMGNKGSITDIEWGPSSGWTFAASHSNIEIRVGHMENTTGVLVTDLATNFRGGSVPQPLYTGQYSIPTNASATWWAFPKLSSPFDYDGSSGLLVDYQVTAAATCQGWKVWAYVMMTGGVGRRAAGAQDRNALIDDGFITNGGTTSEIIFYAQFTKRRRVTEDQSFFYDTGVPVPDYSTPVVTPQTQPSGTSYLLEFQGADAMPDPLRPGRYIANMSTLTEWSASANIADGKRMIRFRFTLYASLNSDVVSRIMSLQIPYTFAQN